MQVRGVIIVAVQRGSACLKMGPRSCNVGPVPPYEAAKLTAALVRYVDAESEDAKLFELGDYADKQKSNGLNMQALAMLSDLMVQLLQVIPWSRAHKVDLKKSFLDCLAKKPRRIIFPKVPKADLAERFSRQVVHFLGKSSKTFAKYSN